MDETCEAAAVPPKRKYPRSKVRYPEVPEAVSRYPDPTAARRSLRMPRLGADRRSRDMVQSGYYRPPAAEWLAILADLWAMDPEPTRAIIRAWCAWPDFRGRTALVHVYGAVTVAQGPREVREAIEAAILDSVTDVRQRGDELLVAMEGDAPAIVRLRVESDELTPPHAVACESDLDALPPILCDAATRWLRSAGRSARAVIEIRRGGA